MAKYKVIRTKQFKKDLKKLDIKNISKVEFVLEILQNGEKLAPKYKDHALKGKYKGLRDCHILPDLVLIYERLESELLLTAIRIKGHGGLF